MKHEPTPKDLPLPNPQYVDIHPSSMIARPQPILPPHASPSRIKSLHRRHNILVANWLTKYAGNWSISECKQAAISLLAKCPLANIACPFFEVQQLDQFDDAAKPHLELTCHHCYRTFQEGQFIQANPIAVFKPFISQNRLQLGLPVFLDPPPESLPIAFHPILEPIEDTPNLIPRTYLHEFHPAPGSLPTDQLRPQGS